MNGSGIELRSLIDAARNADRASLTTLLERYRQYLELLARSCLDRSLQAKAGASDLVQQTMINALNGFGDFRGKTESELAAWLRQILRRNLSELIRQYQTSARKISRDQSMHLVLDHSNQCLADVIAATESSPSHVAARRELGVVLADALTELGEPYREIILLRNFEQLGWEDISKRVGGNSNSVRKQWCRALKRLRPLIEEKI